MPACVFLTPHDIGHHKGDGNLAPATEVTISVHVQIHLMTSI